LRTGPLCTVILAVALTAPPLARAQVPPNWNPGRHVVVVVSGLDSADAYPVVVRALEAEGLQIERSDTARGRIICVPRPSDSYGGGQANVQYLALVHRAPHGGSEIWIGAMVHTLGGQNDASAFARVPAGAVPHQRIEGDFIFVTPNAGREWERLERIAEAVAHTSTH
jgi:hypothetical protein